MVGRTVIVIANLKPAKIRGIESHGMLLAASDADRTALSLVTGAKFTGRMQSEIRCWQIHTPISMMNDLTGTAIW